jgi:hypothetical protein
VKRRLALVAVALVLTGCGSPDEEPKYDSTFGQEQEGDGFERTPAPPQPIDSPDGEDVLVQVLQDQYPNEFGRVAPSTLVEGAESICTGFDSGLGWMDMVKVGLDVGYTGRQTGFLIGASVTTLCPEHEGLLPQ